MNIFFDFLDNLALLVLLIMISPLILKRWKNPVTVSILQGLLFGIISIVGMLNPFEFGPGLIFDPRSVFISLSGFFWGGTAAVISGGMALVCRLMQGGIGTFVGALVIFFSALIGIGFYYLYRDDDKNNKVEAKSLYLLGVVVHVVMLMLMFTLPRDMAYKVLEKIGLIVLLLYPLASLLVGKMIFHFSAGIRLEEELRESKERFKAISDYSNSAICLLGEDGKITWGNEALVKLGGYPLPKLYSGSFVDFLAPQSAEFVVGNFQKFVARQEYVKNYLFYIRRSDGDYRLCEKYMTDFEDRNKKRFLAISMIDITERDTAQKALKKNQEFLKTIIDSLDESVHFVDTNLKLQMVNSSLGEWGRKLGLIIKMDCHLKESFPFITVDNLGDYEKVLRDGKIYSSRETIDYDGKIIHVAVRRIPVYSSLRPLGILTVINDISEKVNIEREKHEIQNQLIHSAKLASVGTLAAGVAHEINNPLSIILGNAELMKEKSQLVGDKNNVEMLQRIISSTERVVKIVDGLSIYAKQDSEKIENVDVHDCINDCLDLVANIFKKKNIEIHTELSAQLSIVDGNTGKLQHVLMNLFNSARETLLNRKDAFIRISTQNKDKGILILINDNGIGIPNEIRTQLFDPLMPTKETGWGIGLGMAISCSIIESFRGKMDFESEDGVGTTYKIFLPLVGDKKCIKISRKILVVDDEEHIRTILSAYLSMLGYEVLCAENGFIALEMISNIAFDYVITDIKMPGMRGDELLQKIRELPGCEKIKLYYISGGLGDYSKEQIERLQKNANGFLDKPFKKEDIVQLFKKAESGADDQN